MKQVIKLTEADIQNMVNESVSRIINETTDEAFNLRQGMNNFWRGLRGQQTDAEQRLSNQLNTANTNLATANSNLTNANNNLTNMSNMTQDYRNFISRMQQSSNNPQMQTKCIIDFVYKFLVNNLLKQGVNPLSISSAFTKIANSVNSRSQVKNARTAQNQERSRKAAATRKDRMAKVNAQNNNQSMAAYNNQFNYGQGDSENMDTLTNVGNYGYMEESRSRRKRNRF